jgi:hypothetical protein
LNFCHLDLVAREFPNARMLHCRRDPRDTALSCYTQYFAHADMAWSSSWDDLIESIGATANGSKHAHLASHGWTSTMQH